MFVVVREQKFNQGTKMEKNRISWYSLLLAAAVFICWTQSPSLVHPHRVSRGQVFRRCRCWKTHRDHKNHTYEYFRARAAQTCLNENTDSVDYWYTVNVILHLFTKRSRSIPSRLAHPPFLLLSKKPTDGRLDAFLLTGLVEGVLAAVGAAAICWETEREKGKQTLR